MRSWRCIRRKKCSRTTWKSSILHGTFFLSDFLNDAPVANLFVLRATCDDLMKEYKACESPDYISYVGYYSTQICGILLTLPTNWSECGGLARTQLSYSVSPSRITRICLVEARRTFLKFGEDVSGPVHSKISTASWKKNEGWNVERIHWGSIFYSCIEPNR